MVKTSTSMRNELLYVGLSLVCCLQLQATPRSLNQRPLLHENVRYPYSFLAGGHLYGSIDKQTSYPAATLIGSIEKINNSKSLFFAGLGDLIKLGNKAHVMSFKTSFLDRLRMPMFNAVGNHDLFNKRLYEAYFGKRHYFHFKILNQLYIFLDTESSDAKIDGEQRRYLRALFDKVKKSEEVESVFIHTHHLIWINSTKELKSLRSRINRRNEADEVSFNKDVAPLLESLSKKKQVYWLSGDLGAPWSIPFLYYSSPTENLTFVASGLADHSSDALVKVTLLDRTSVRLSLFPLDSSTPQQIQHYSPSYWNKHSKTKNTTFQILKRFEFWLFSLLVAIVFASGFLFFRKKTS